jgi:hypothetical protein
VWWARGAGGGELPGGRAEVRVCGADLREQPLLFKARIDAARGGPLPRLSRVAREDVERAPRRRGQLDEYPLPPLRRELL